MTLPPPTTTTVISSKTYLNLTPTELSTLQLRVYRHTRQAPVQESVLQTFVDLANASFTGAYHDENFGRDKPRYNSVEVLKDDLDPLEEGQGEGEAVAGAKITFSGYRMDCGPSLHTSPNPLYQPPPTYPPSIFYLGALGTITPTTGPLLLSHIKSYLSSLTPNYVLKAYTVAEWGINPTFTIPRESPLVRFFEKQGFNVVDYAWKPKGTWGSFFGGCLCSIEYVHASA